MSLSEVDVNKAIADLRELSAKPDCSRRVAEVAQQRADGIEIARDYLIDRAHRIAFVGTIGVGKSSMIGVLTDLLIGDPPTDKPSLKDNSVLAVGSGGTTVCEVRIRNSRPNDRGQVGLIIDPYTVEEMMNEIHLFASDEWARRKSPESLKTGDDDRDPTPREIQRVIRNMTGLVERYETVNEGGARKKRSIDPLDDVIAQHDSSGSLANHLIDRASLLSRTETEWWWERNSDAFHRLKERFDGINHGKIPTAMLPKLITIVTSETIPGLPGGHNVEVVDTRGFDGQLSGRPDIQTLLRDSRALVVACLPFRDAPGETIKELLKDILDDAELRPSTPRMPLVLIDQGDALGVNGCDGDREFGQQLKQAECRRSLQTAGAIAFCDENNISSFDTLQDDRRALIELFANRIDVMRANVERSLIQQIDDATSFLSNLDIERVELARQEIDRRVATTIKATFPGGAPLRDPLEGLYTAVRVWRFASQIWSSCRHNGRGSSMDAFAVVRTGAARAATEWLAQFDISMIGFFKTLEVDIEFLEVQDHVRLRKAQYTAGHVSAVGNYADSVLAEVEQLLSDDEVWGFCSREWGRGSGFKDRVIEHLKNWSRDQSELRAHRQANANKMLPQTLLLTE